ncbi:MAG: hypothetical protein NZ700_06125 [Gemmataceae bacterium]|nr:hypothetical protein [Gemmataceae bacterium]MDW8266977.1 hypothetical protein [Gemmataceae bacterium]
MFRPRPDVQGRRRGVILLVVVSMLTLFAIVGLSFVLYAEAEATASRNFRDAQAPFRPDAEPELLFNYFLEQLIFDCPDNETGVYSAMRGHGMVRAVFGGEGDTPFNGAGRIHAPGVFGEDDYYLTNYTYFPSDGFVRDPERAGTRQSPVHGRGPFIGGFNVPYTYPDHNNMFLAAVDNTGRVIMPSFHRPWAIKPEDWTSPGGKYKIMRPRPIDHLGFPPMEDATGDVKNLIGAPGGNDSIWMDLDFPVLVAPDGRKYKALFAPLIIDLDNRLNVNYHGNVMAKGKHASNQGIGPWEVNISRVMGPDWPNLFSGNAGLGANYPHGPGDGRFGRNNNPGPNGNAMLYLRQRFQGLNRPLQYAALDFNGCNEITGAPSTPLGVPGAGAPPLSCFPLFNPPGQQVPYGNCSDAEITNHGCMTGSGDDRYIHPSNLEALYRFDDTNAPALASSLLRLCPQTFSTPRSRLLFTTDSWDLDTPALAPYIWNFRDRHPDPERSPAFEFNATRSPWYPTGGSINFPTPLQVARNAPWPGEFINRRYKSAVAALLSRLDMTRWSTSTLGGQNFLNPLVAQTARTIFAEAIFDRLRWVCGIPVHRTDFSRLPGPQKQALRWLAQLAVNIVDYVDDDDMITSFNWYVDPEDPTNNDTVYGFETPNVVLNEAYVEVTNLKQEQDDGLKDSKEPKATKLRGNVWVELYNPKRLDPNNKYSRQEGYGNINLMGPGGFPRYRIVLVYPNRWQSLKNDQNSGGSFVRREFRNPKAPSCIDPAKKQAAIPVVGKDLLHVPMEQQDNPIPDEDDWCITRGLAGNSLLRASNDQYNSVTGAGFLVLRPTDLTYLIATKSGRPFLARDPFAANPRVQSNSAMSKYLSFVLFDQEGGGQPRTKAQVKDLKPTILLQRLMILDAPPNPPGIDQPVNPDLPLNEYVTVDYLEDVHVNYAVELGMQGEQEPDPIQQRYSEGRVQPYAARRLSMTGQPTGFIRPQEPQPPQNNQPRHTFQRHNGRDEKGPQPPGSGDTLVTPFYWITHLDRQPINGIELLQTSAYSPAEVLQEFFKDPALVTDAERLVYRDGLVPYRHIAPWYDQRARIYRFLEFVNSMNFSNAAPNNYISVPGSATQNSDWDMNRNGQTALNNIAPWPDDPNYDMLVPRAMFGRNADGTPWRITKGSILLIDEGANQEVVVCEDVNDPNNPIGVKVKKLKKPHYIDNRSTPPIYGKIQVVAGGVDPNPAPGDRYILPRPEPATYTCTRLPGRINLNTLWDEETFIALCDPPDQKGAGPNHFDINEVRQIFRKMLLSRTPDGVPGPKDRPFRGMGQGFTLPDDPQYPLGSGIEDTFLRSDPTNPRRRLFQIGATPEDGPAASEADRHPFVQNQLLAKIYNNITCRSNVFAVWLTVGFFEVRDDTVRPFKLGPEMGRAEGRHVRHRMFCIIDRSRIATNNSDVELRNVKSINPVVPHDGDLGKIQGIGIAHRVAIWDEQVVRDRRGRTFKTFENFENQIRVLEVQRDRDGRALSFTADFKLPHDPKTAVIRLLSTQAYQGHSPGTQRGFMARQWADFPMVLYHSIID